MGNDSNTTNRPSAWYWVAWILVMTAIIAFQNAGTYGWAILASPEHLVEVLGSGIAGGAVLGWIASLIMRNRKPPGT